ncbi:MAG: SAM-dependent methyltransferase, partial [Acidobacteriota bacterium]
VVTCLQGRIEDVKPPEPVDVIVSVLTGNFLLTEDLLRTLYHARDTVLAPGGVLIPSAATMEAVPVSLPEVHAREIGGWSTPQHGVDLSPARAYAANTIFYRPEGLGDARPLAEPKVLHTVDLTKDQYTALDVDAAFEVIRSGQCHGWLGWFSMKLGDRWLSTSPFEPPLHWSPAFLPLDPPMPVRAGETLSLALNRAPFGDWIWSATAASTMQQHSTLLSAPVNLSTVRKVAVTFRPSLDPEGAAVQYVLSCCDGSTTVERIAKLLSDRFPQRYPAHEDALGFVQRLVKRYA